MRFLFTLRGINHDFNLSLKRHFSAYCGVPENIHTPPSKGIGISWGEGFVEDQKILRNV